MLQSREKEEETEQEKNTFPSPHIRYRKGRKTKQNKH
jgi:hypothetical protein